MSDNDEDLVEENPMQIVIYRAKTGLGSIRFGCTALSAGWKRTTIFIEDAGKHSCMISCMLEKAEYVSLKTYIGAKDIEEVHYVPEWECLVFCRAEEEDGGLFIDVGRGSIRVNNTIMTPACD